jgi:UDP-3-O-[3-hydroxymyristoyl] glucosamine N-acyltransferase
LKLTLGEIASRLNLESRGDASLEISGISSLADARPGQLTFLFNATFRHYLATTRASAVVLADADAEHCPIPVLISPQPRMTWARVAGFFDSSPGPDRQIHPTASIAATATLGQGVSVGPHVVIEAGATIGDAVVLGAGCYIGHGASIGTGTRLHPNVTLYHGVVIGNDAIIHSSTVIGADGFGFEFDSTTLSMVKIPQIYGVRIGDDVEIGAGCTIDRGALNDTVIDDGVKLDNQVQVGHNTCIGKHTVISGCTAIAGSTRIGSYCLIGGAVGIIDNIEIVDWVEITAMTLVSRSITERGRYSSGTGLMPSNLWKRSIVGFSRLDQLIKRVRGLESRSRGS